MVKNILIVDDHLVVQAGVAMILQSEIDNLMVSYASNFFESLSKVTCNFFDLIILDINIPGGNNTAMIDDIRKIHSDVKILIFSAHEEEFYALRYLQSGANGYLNKLSNEEKIIEAVSTIIKSGEYISDDLKEKLLNSKHNRGSINPFDKLSKRELEIVKLLVSGYGNLEISNSLNIKMTTVSTYKNRVFEKLKINNFVELIEKHNLYFS